MNRFEKNMDKWITGNYGEDNYYPTEEEKEKDKRVKGW